MGGTSQHKLRKVGNQSLKVNSPFYRASREEFLDGVQVGRVGDRGVAVVGGEHVAHLLPENDHDYSFLCVLTVTIIPNLMTGSRAARDSGGDDGGQWITRSPGKCLFSLES